MVSFTELLPFIRFSLLMVGFLPVAAVALLAGLVAEVFAWACYYATFVGVPVDVAVAEVYCILGHPKASLCTIVLRVVLSIREWQDDQTASVEWGADLIAPTTVVVKPLLVSESDSTTNTDSLVFFEPSVEAVELTDVFCTTAPADVVNSPQVHRSSPPSPQPQPQPLSRRRSPRNHPEPKTAPYVRKRSRDPSPTTVTL